MNPLLVIGLVFLAAYVYSCWRNPYTERKCPWCKGRTRRHGWMFPAWRDRRKCWWCGSESKRRRWGAMLIGRR
jgi:hypothetical protein